MIFHYIDDSDEDGYLVEGTKKKLKLSVRGTASPAETVSELQERADVIKKKFEQRKATRKNTNKSERRKLRQEKLLNKQKVLNRKKIMTNELLKQERATLKVEIKQDPENNSKLEKIYNKEGKMFFSKVQIDGEKKKKTVDTNPQLNLQKLKAQKKKLKELVETGDKLKAREEKAKILWKTAFEKTDGIKVKDNADILKKTIKKRKVEKKKSKQKWGQRKDKVEEKKAAAQKKREDNLSKRITDKQKTKMKHVVKKGRMIKGVSG